MCPHTFPYLIQVSLKHNKNVGNTTVSASGISFQSDITYRFADYLPM